PPPVSPLFPYPTLFRSRAEEERAVLDDRTAAFRAGVCHVRACHVDAAVGRYHLRPVAFELRGPHVAEHRAAKIVAAALGDDVDKDRKSTRLNSSHEWIS